MEDRTQLTVNGQELQQSDVNNLGKVSALADDRVLAEFLRLAPFSGGTVTRAVTAFGFKGNPSTLAGIVRPSGNSGAVCVNAFRAIVGSRASVASIGAKENWRDIRSGVFTNATGLTNDPTISLAANGSGNPRWDLIYATLAVDANGPSVTRYVKNPTTLATSANSLVSTLVSSVTVGVVTGAPLATPVRPATPADAGSSYVIPLAYVRVPTGFGATSAVLASDIHIVAPMATPSAASGGTSVRVASSNSQVTQIPSLNLSQWGSNGTRPGAYVPADMVGGHELMVFIDLLGLTGGTISHANGALVDDTIDWSRRYFKWMASMGAVSGYDHMNLNVDLVTSGAADIRNCPAQSPTLQAQGMGASFANTLGTNLSKVCNLVVGAGGPASGFSFPSALVGGAPAAGTLGLYVDRTTGNLRFFSDGSVTGCAFLIWLTASGQFANA
jgi:hypothetical protein